MVWAHSYESPYLKVDPERRRFQVKRSVYTDPAVFRLEKQRILYRSWVYLGHASEVRNPNDYLVRQVIDKNVILVRDRTGEIRAFLNTCPHRGAQICRDKAGNRKTFSCPYHGWTFANSGELRSMNAPFGYPDNFNEGGVYKLSAVPRVAQRSDFIFVNFDANAQPLDEYLADAGDRIDMMAQHSGIGLEVVSGCHEYYIRANYKLMSENSYDGYHLEPTHGSFLDYQLSMLKGTERKAINGRGVSLGNGHACFEMDIQAGRPIAQWLPVWGEEARVAIEVRKQELLQRVGRERGEIIAGVHRNMIVFPNTVMNDQQTILIRSTLPLSHNEMIVRAWSLGPVDETPVLRRIRLEGALSFLGPGGFATPDDIEIIESCQRGYEMGGIEWNDVSKGFRPEENTLRDADTAGGNGWANELQMRAYWTQYDRVMSAA